MSAGQSGICVSVKQKVMSVAQMVTPSVAQQLAVSVAQQLTVSVAQKVTLVTKRLRSVEELT
jgi:hypothetical protein